MAWVNLPTAGVLGAAKHDFVLTSVTNLLAAYKRNSVAVFVHGNKAGETRTKSRCLGYVAICSAGSFMLL